MERVEMRDKSNRLTKNTNDEHKVVRSDYGETPNINPFEMGNTGQSGLPGPTGLPGEPGLGNFGTSSNFKNII